MATIPVKFSCDFQGCQSAPVTAHEAAQRKWYVVVASTDPAYIAINPWASIGRIPSGLKQWHACRWDHALDIQAFVAAEMKL